MMNQCGNGLNPDRAMLRRVDLQQSTVGKLKRVRPYDVSRDMAQPIFCRCLCSGSEQIHTVLMFF